jgi:hypothetical protein
MRLTRQGWRHIGRDQVLHVMRTLGVRGVRRGRIPVTTRPARSRGGREDLVRRIRGCGRFLGDGLGH